MTSWWQKKLFQYTISHLGLFEDGAFNIDDLNLSWGRRSTIELRNLPFNTVRIAQLLQLPPSLRIEAAKLLHLRLTVPVNLSGIEAEADGIEVTVRLIQENESTETGKSKAKLSVFSETPNHRKSHRRIHSSHGRRGSSDLDADLHIPTTDELAKSFLLDEPLHERQKLEASLVASAKSIDESAVSDSSESDNELGIGSAVPNLLSVWLQRIVDQAHVQVKNIVVKLHTETGSDGPDSLPLTMRLHVTSVDLAPIDSTLQNEGSRRNVEVREVSVDLLKAQDVSSVFSNTSPIASKRQPHTSSQKSLPTDGGESITARHAGYDNDQGPVDENLPVDAFDSGIPHEFTPHHGTEFENTSVHDLLQASELDIQPGDDNISWGSRRSKSSGPAEDLWSSMASEDDSPESLLLERTSTPRASPSRSVSPAVTRSRRAVSPYGRGTQSPGSRPQLEEIPKTQGFQSSPGFWPAAHHSHRTTFEPSTPGHAQDEEDPMDNKRVAVKSARRSHYDSQDDAELMPADSDTDDLIQSKMYTHEEAESLYMSAMTQGPGRAVPGGWEPEHEVDDHGGRPEVHPQVELDGETYSHAYSSPADRDSQVYGETATPRAASPTRSASPIQDEHMRSVQLVNVHRVSIWLSLDAHGSSHDASTMPPAAPKQQPGPKATVSMPGTFSAYSGMVASSHSTQSLNMEKDQTHKEQQPDDHSGTRRKVDVMFGSVVVSTDLTSCRLLSSVVSMATRTLESEHGSPSTRPQSANAASRRPVDMPVAVRVEQLHFSLTEQLQAGQRSTADVGLVTLECRGLAMSHSAYASDLKIGSVDAWISGSKLLTFDTLAPVGESTILTDTTNVVAVNIYNNKLTVRNQPVYEVHLMTMPIRLDFDLVAIDDTLSSLGGLSGIIEMSSTPSAHPTVSYSPRESRRPAKGVRFAGDTQGAPSGPEVKVNGRISGINVSLHGETCGIKLETSTLKVVYREKQSSTTAEHVVLTGPYLSQEQDPAVSVALHTLRLDQFQSPGDRDLERLISLLTPSKDKYDTDNDILLDTLLRQRRKGSLLRASIGEIKVKVGNYQCLKALSNLGKELSRLSAVAKYLPEDDRPGLLSLLRIGQVKAVFPVNDKFGRMQVVVKELLCAHVGLPALSALSVGGISAARDDSGVGLIHALVPLTGVEALPMIMARTLGDEAEPTIKVKLFNICLEYDVPTVMALIGNPDTDAEELVLNLVESVAGLATPRLVTTSAETIHSTRAAATKRTNVKLLIHDCGLGLTPAKGVAKGLLILTDAKASTMFPPCDLVMTSLELRKAAMFVVDNRNNSNTTVAAPSRSASVNTATSSRVSSSLASQGYASIASIMTARISVSIEEDKNSALKAVEVNVSSELLLLETCADSTQTLFAILGGLAPPSPPSKQPKYLTQPMTIEDMMASFTGEPMPRPIPSRETLFDMDKQGNDTDNVLGRPELYEEVDDLLADSEMTSSLYGPISGVFGNVDHAEDDDGLDVFPETVESLLEDDPFEMPISPTDMPMSDGALMRDLAKQCKSVPHTEAVNLGFCGIEDLGFEALPGLGSHNRFNHPFTRPKVNSRRAKARLPFQLKVRDTHVIWNLHDGYDWQRTRDGIEQVVQQVEARAEERVARRHRSHNPEEEEDSVIGDFLFNSIYVGVPNTHDAQELRRQINRGIDDMVSETESVPISGISRPTAFSASGRPLRQQHRRRLKLERSKAHKIAFELKGLAVDIMLFPEEKKDTVNAIDLRVRDFEVFDNLPTSTWRKFLTCLHNDVNTREIAKPMAHIEVQTVRTLQDLAATELVIHVSLLPLKLHVDQDALDFVARFFEFKDDTAAAAPVDPNDQPFIQRLEVETVDLQLDYKPRRIDYGGLRSGHTTELMNIIALEAANISLKHAIIYGMKGFDPLHKTLNDIWMPDVKRNQLPTVLAGLAPMRSLVNIGSGVRDVIAIPIREYRKDGRIVRSIQKGALQFGKTTTSELARLGAKLAIGTQTMLQGAEGMLSPVSGSSSSRRVSNEQGWYDTAEESDEHEQRRISAYADQPIGVLSGLRSARLHLERDLLTAKDAFIAVQGEVMESGSPGAAAAAVARYAPTLILRPVIGATRAVGTTLLGVGNQIDRRGLRRMEDKYKRR
ncbi:hypothetical protein LTR62_006420 [Meristemomyces frigidus]|uniref:Autophagy-related protein 2 n=1 Tax=Meristemomyces frigidus TaxID=1508187 RepID=A0AAN7TC34_9PEZI|nr:hypothetical protein LTR62_006420 [Meristemomyces frigidus]